jgi:Asp-tRNA(Asn)/Glu-tRNA(Gln) amidotransferase A subunit family amidase
MTNYELCWLEGSTLASLVRQREVSPTEAVKAVLEQLERVNPKINAFVTVLAEAALQQAAAAEKDVMNLPAESLGALHGVPITVKDLTDTQGVRTTYGSLEYRDHVPARDSVSWSRLKKAGAILIGKTTTPEFGMLGITDSKLTGRTSNPWAVTHTSGGSSGGAAASVAAGIAPFAWGSDGGGSIRVPAACCGVVGFKASRGRIPVDKLWESVGTDGPLTRSVMDSALLLSVTAGPYSRDPFSLPAPNYDFVASLSREASLAGVKIAYSPDFGTANADPEVLKVVGAAVDMMRDLGAEVDEVSLSLPDPVEYFEKYWSPSFAAAFGEDVASGKVTRDNVHPMTWDIASIGLRMSAVDYYRTSTELRGRITTGFADVLDQYDLIVTPTMPVTAFPHPGEEAGPTEINGIPVRRPAIDFHRMTEPPSHAGLPAISIPCGFSDSGLPVGLQLIGPHLNDISVLRAAAVYEAASPWKSQRPNL